VWGRDAQEMGPRTAMRCSEAAIARVLVSASAALERAATAEL